MYTLSALGSQAVALYCQQQARHKIDSACVLPFIAWIPLLLVCICTHSGMPMPLVSEMQNTPGSGTNASLEAAALFSVLFSTLEITESIIILLKAF